MGQQANSNVRSSKYVTIMAFKPKQQQVITNNHKQIQSLSEHANSTVVNDMLRSFDLENNHENLEKEDNPFDYFLQSTAWLPYPVTNVYKNDTIRIQKGVVLEIMNICRITLLNILHLEFTKCRVIIESIISTK
jgi:hypothetical protein